MWKWKNKYKNTKIKIEKRNKEEINMKIILNYRVNYNVYCV